MDRPTAEPGVRYASLVTLLLALAPASLPAQGWIEPPGPRPPEWRVERVRSEVRVRVEGPVAVVEVSEWFRNPGPAVAEGDYLHPLPGEAAFEGFSLFQGDTELRGEIMDRERARAIYEEIVRRRADPALIELAGHGLLRARVFPIEPGATRRVSLRYTQLLERAGDALHFRWAGSVASVRPHSSGAPPGSGRGEGPREPSPGDFELVVEDGRRFADPFSPTHRLRHERAGGRLVVRPEGALEGRLSVFLPLAREGLGLAVLAHRTPGEDGYLMLTLSPGPGDAPPEPRDVTVVVDVSGSMSGEKIEQARTALVDLVRRLDPRDRFRLVAFSNAVRPWREGWAQASPGEVEAAVAWVRGLQADGGTLISGALEEAFRAPSPADRLPVVVFLTDGLPSVGERDPERIAAEAEARRGRARVFALGVGTDVNTRLLDRLSAATRGSTTYVERGESVERALSLLAARITHPVLTDVALEGAPARVRELYPVALPDVFAGEALVLFARYQGSGSGPLTVRGRRGGRDEVFTVEASLPRLEEANAFLPRLWASRKLGHLTRLVALEGASDALVAEIRETALRYGLPSEHTAYLVLEPGALAQGGRPAVNLQEARISRGRDGAANGVGAEAFRWADEAARFRDVRTSADVLALEEERQEAVGSGGGGHPRRSVAGRLFELRDGVWTEVRPAGAEPPRTVRLYSRAWFDLLAALPELTPWASLGAVEVGGARLVLRFAEGEGAETLRPEELEGLVRGFRAAAR